MGRRKDRLGGGTRLLKRSLQAIIVHSSSVRFACWRMVKMQSSIVDDMTRSTSSRCSSTHRFFGRHRCGDRHRLPHGPRRFDARRFIDSMHEATTKMLKWAAAHFCQRVWFPYSCCEARRTVLAWRGLLVGDGRVVTENVCGAPWMRRRR